uniref:glycine-rich domain-containing protein n=2 Tax=Enterocloster clostridioformis TaxID=1531 RepID=UPI002FE6DEB5
MTVNSILSFNVAAYSGRRVLLKWQNPYAAPGKPYCGVIIKASTGGYPAWNASAWDAIYAGAGDNVTPGGWSQVFMDLPALNTTYYFTCFGYATTNFGEIYSPVYDPASIKKASVTTGVMQLITITGTQNYTIPEGFSILDIFCLGGGGGGAQSRKEPYDLSAIGGGGGGGGYTITVFNIAVSAGQVINCFVGAGGNSNNNGGGTSVWRDGVSLCNADGGYSGQSPNSNNANGGAGGSGGGGGCFDNTSGYGGSDGNPGGGWSSTTGSSSSGGAGQGRTTRAFGEPQGTLYSGGGSGGAGQRRTGTTANVGSPGSGGGAYGGRGNVVGGSASPNTGGGGGGGGSLGNTEMPGGTGGSGIILLRLR